MQMGRFKPNIVLRLGLLTSLLAALYGCPMASPGAGAPAAVSGGASGIETPSNSASNSDGSTTDSEGKKEAPADITRSQPVAMPSGVFSQGPTPECTIVLHLNAKPVCFYANSAKRIEFSGKVTLECLENEVGTFSSPTLRILNKDEDSTEFTEFLLQGDDHTFSGAAKTHLPKLNLDSCFANRDPIGSFAGPGLLDMTACTGEECYGKCDGVFDRIEIEEINPHPVPNFSLPGESTTFRTANLLPPCGDETAAKKGTEPLPIIIAPPEDPVVCKTTSGGLFRCTQGRETFCATLFGERRECP